MNTQPLSETMPTQGEGEDYVHIANPTVQRLRGSMVRVEDPSGAPEPESNDLDASQQRKVLPEELWRSVLTLTCDSTADGGVCDVYLVGTSHVSPESCIEVEAVNCYLKPQVVFLELCSSRVAMLSPRNLKVPTMGEMIDMWKKNGNIFRILYSWFFAKVADKLEVLPGSEFRMAYEEARKYGGRVILGDRPVQVVRL